MKILFSALSYPTKEYPFASFIGAMAEELAHRGHDVTVIAPQSVTQSFFRNSHVLPKKQIINCSHSGKTIKIFRPYSITFGNGRFRGRLTLLFNQIAVHRITKKLDDKFDIVYCHFWRSAFQILPFVVKKDLPMVVVCGEDSISLTKYLTVKELDCLRRLTKQTIAVSTKNKKECISLRLADEDKIKVIPNGPDVSLFYPHDKNECRDLLALNKNDFIVCFVGRFIHRKGVLRVENAILSLCDPSIKAIFIGSTMKDEDKDQEPTGSEVAYKGVVPHDKVPLYLSASDVYVLPTLAEGCSNSIVEGMACGLPVISSDSEFNHDILDKSNSILVNPLKVDEIAGAILKLKNDKDLRDRMSKNSLNKAKELSFSKKVDKIEAIIKSLVK